MLEAVHASEPAALRPVWFPKFGAKPASVDMLWSPRDHGVSPPPFDSLNLGFGVGDAPSNVAANRRSFASAAGFDLRRAVQPMCTGNGQVFLVDLQDVGRGIWATDPTLAGDGVVSSLPNVTLLVSAADDVPVYLAATDGSAVGLLRIGWRALLNGVLRNTVALFEQIGVSADALCFAFGPSIGPCCCHVAEDVADRCRESFSAGVGSRFESGRGFSLNLQGAIAYGLDTLGVTGSYERAPCTACNADLYFSKHASGASPTGRHFGGIRRTVTEPSARQKRFLPMLQENAHSCGG
jgi:polyphenol oxidase